MAEGVGIMRAIAGNLIAGIALTIADLHNRPA
jgi:hypothetical protein